MILWQDVLDMINAGRPDGLICPYCGDSPMTVAEQLGITKVSCTKCGKFIEGRFQ